MLNPPEKLIEQILNRKSNSISGLVHRSKHFKQLDNFVKRFLNKELHNHCRVYDYKDNCLIIATDSPHWHLRLRYQTSSLLSCLRQEKSLCGLASIKIIVQPEQNKINLEHEKPIRTNHQVPEHAPNQISETAELITDEDLKDSLKKLAQSLSES